MSKPELTVEELSRYLQSGNNIEVTQVTMKAHELRFLLDRIAELEEKLERQDYHF